MSRLQQWKQQWKDLVAEIREIYQYRLSLETEGTAKKSRKFGKNPSEKLNFGEISLLVGLLLGCMGTAWLSAEQEELASGMIRLHIVANSNSPEDQALKLVVRDAILTRAEEYYVAGMSHSEAVDLFSEKLEEFSQVGATVSGGYEVQVSLKELWFPTKDYEYFALPAGEYTSLHVEIGEAEGENWWCVAYPPLCLGAVSETVEVAVSAGHFSSGEGEMITGEGYVLKFQSMELLGKLRGWLS